MADIALAFLWHQHQPYYPDDVAGENSMPWVRLHGVKDYYGMALHLLEVPEMQCTINLVPSLLRQLLDYTERGGSDRFLDVSRIPADGLSEADCLFLLDHFFMANPDRMILPYARYAELYTRRGAGQNTAREALRRFSARDFRDLQVWFNLAWIHPLAVASDEFLTGLRDQGRNFTEEDKSALLGKHIDILRRILPLHQQLADRGQVELTTTPYFHPILPLLFDKQLARAAMPDVRLPPHTCGYPEDAAVHVSRAVAQHAGLFGRAPRGMWPAEGAVCQSMLPLLAEHGIRWIATDEEILTASTHGHVRRDDKGHVVNPDQLYRPYKVREGQAELGIVFRDHALSDMIGFHYQRSDAAAAVDHFFGCLHGISQVTPGHAPALVSVILDGENCWEHYPNGGVDFLRALYQRCTTNPGVRPVCIGDYLERFPPHDTLGHLAAGSWINHNFAIWIGHEEDNTAWDLLHRTRTHLAKKTEQGAARHDKRETTGTANGPAGAGGAWQPVALAARASPIARAWEELYIAEGSDWFWWYGDDHSSAQDALFDYLFRKHLRNVYLLLGDEPPAELGRAIKRAARREIYSAPRGFLDVRIDGRFTFFEWLRAGRYTCQNERGTMAMAHRGVLKELFFGFDLDRLFLRIDCEGQARPALARYDLLRVAFLEPAGFEVWVREPGRAAQAVEFARDGRLVPVPVPIGIDRIIELALPFDALGVKVGDAVQFFVELQQNGQGLDRAPREGAIALNRPSADFEHIMWDVQMDADIDPGAPAGPSRLGPDLPLGDSPFALKDLPMPELRKDPIVGRWVIIATERAKRPAALKTEPIPSGAFCPFCEGNEDKTPHEILAYRERGTQPNERGWRVRAVPNKFPALQIEGDLNKRGDGIYDKMNGVGAHEVILECPFHEVSLANLAEDNIREVLWVYRDRLVDLKKDPRLVYGMVFKNVGAAAGASLEHSHSQLIVTPIVPINVWEEMSGSIEFFNYRGRCIYCDMVHQELGSEKRVVLDTPNFLCFCPYASRFPFETWIVPKTHNSHYENIQRNEVDELGTVLKTILLKLETALDRPAYNYIIHTSPFDTGLLPHYHWHMEVIPRLTRVAGFEWGTGFYINPVPPEQSAQFLAQTEVDLTTPKEGNAAT